MKKPRPIDRAMTVRASRQWALVALSRGLPDLSVRVDAAAFNESMRRVAETFRAAAPAFEEAARRVRAMGDLMQGDGS